MIQADSISIKNKIHLPCVQTLLRICDCYFDYAQAHCMDGHEQKE